MEDLFGINAHRQAVQENIEKAFDLGFDADNNIEGIEKAKHQVGDIHPNGRWVWTEYAPGKFDWKSLKGKHHKGSQQATSKTSVDISKISDKEFNSITKILEKKNPDDSDAFRYLESEEMNDKELANFIACAKHFKNDIKNINETTRKWCAKWEKLGEEEIERRKNEKQEEKKESEKIDIQDYFGKRPTKGGKAGNELKLIYDTAIKAFNNSLKNKDFSESSAEKFLKDTFKSFYLDDKEIKGYVFYSLDKWKKAVEKYNDKNTTTQQQNSNRTYDIPHIMWAMGESSKMSAAVETLADVDFSDMSEKEIKSVVEKLPAEKLDKMYDKYIKGSKQTTTQSTLSKTSSNDDLFKVGELKNGFKFKKNTEYVLRYNKYEKQYEVFENKTQRGAGKIPMWVCKSDNGDEKFGEKILKVVQKNYSKEGSTISFGNKTYPLSL